MGFVAPEWLRTFAVLHERAARGELEAPELHTYRHGREVLARVLLAAQQVTLPLGQAARRSLRVARALQVDVECDGQGERAPTLDVSASGFAAWIAMPLTSGHTVTVTLSLPGDRELHALATVVRIEPLDASAHSTVGFQFLGLSEPQSERLQIFVFGALLEHMK
jgi:hypothetical protein